MHLNSKLFHFKSGDNNVREIYHIYGNKPDFHFHLWKQNGSSKTFLFQSGSESLERWTSQISDLNTFLIQQKFKIYSSYTVFFNAGYFPDATSQVIFFFNQWRLSNKLTKQVVKLCSSWADPLFHQIHRCRIIFKVTPILQKALQEDLCKYFKDLHRQIWHLRP